MAKNGQKIVEFFWGASHMINNNIFNIFCFLTFYLGYFTNPAFWLYFKKIALKTGSRKYPREKVEELKMLKMSLFIIHEDPQKNCNHFLAILGHFYPISLEKFALTPKTPTPQFTRNLILTPTGK